ncbi:EAL domain-containing protein [Thalassospira sp. GO-4]|jgi:diguanylate cyclase (GGDEF)-like protein/PAS domain S-box-containing protein|uniref:EAL domain-containing protein n=1 Tax=unclassified Thalassospira TaxID=2648997 RepID=UPI000C68B5F0|nr:MULTISPECIES: EAL domain-containing protein [unclassified Thalassospira]MAL40962.1 histidine kinase [Thalassospira sp.]MEE3047230.1 EAL domain-containing protein [Pseudomonadota bacterium]URK17239.1 EAL domain-containing protein [Thalassospira sp. GO-4]
MIRPTPAEDRSFGLTVGTLSPGTVLSCSPATPLAQAVTKMRNANSSSIIVVQSNKPVGILTEHDLLSLPANSKAVLSQPVEMRMSHPVHTISIHASPQSAIVRMRERNVRHLVTVDENDCLVGIISRTDLIRQISNKKPFSANDVADAVRRSTIFVDARMPVSELRHRMHGEKCDSAIVTGFPADLPVDQQTGIITERDILRGFADNNDGLTAGDIATRPVMVINGDVNLNDARTIMLRKNIRHLVVHNQHREIIGVLSFADLLEFIEQDYLIYLNNINDDSDSELVKARQSLALARKLIENSPDCVMVCNARAEIEAVNPAFTRVTGYQAEEVIGKNPSILQSGRQSKDFYRQMWVELARTGKWEGEIWNRRKSGETFPEWLSIMAIRDSDGTISHYASIFTDISEREKNREDILRIAFTDELTGMPNRRRFSELLSLHVGRARQHGRPLTVMMLDLDNFQRVNNALGHNAGDDVLVEVSRRISRELGHDAVMARVGADEYAAILPDIKTEQEALNLAERVLVRLGEPHLTSKGDDLYLSASIGIASFPKDANDTSNLLRCVEIAMLQAKEQGRNRVGRFSVSLQSQKGADLALETALRRALDNNELHLAYQPQFDTKTGQLCGVEALARWTTASGEHIPPSTFIPVAEEIGVIGELGRWVMRTACRQLVNWRSEGLHNLRLAVNVSVQQFYGTVDLAEQLRAILVDKGLSADRLEIEVTESLFMRDMADMRAKLQRIQDLGIRISLDDFGTGFSSLSYLRTLPFDQIKLDRSFVTDIDRGEEGRTLAITIINMARNLGKTCIAEGVENDRQLEVLRDAGCDLVQGYLLGRPMSAQDISRLATATDG